MSFEYSVKFNASPEDEFNFSELKDGASMWSADISECREIARSYNTWSILNRASFMAEVHPVGYGDTKRRGYRVWIRHSENGAVSTDVDPLPLWVADRVRITEEEPETGWMRTSYFYEDFIKWCKHRGFNSRYLPAATAFSQRAKNEIDATFRRRSQGMVIIGAVLKPAGDI